jgi:hypothetical protein
MGRPHRAAQGGFVYQVLRQPLSLAARPRRRTRRCWRPGRCRARRIGSPMSTRRRRKPSCRPCAAASCAAARWATRRGASERCVGWAWSRHCVGKATHQKEWKWFLTAFSRPHFSNRTEEEKRDNLTDLLSLAIDAALSIATSETFGLPKAAQKRIAKLVEIPIFQEFILSPTEEIAKKSSEKLAKSVTYFLFPLFNRILTGLPTWLS